MARKRQGWYGRPDIGKKVSEKRRGGATWASIADDLGVSTSTLYNWREKGTKMRESTADRVRDEILYEQVDEPETITYSQFQEESYMTGMSERKEQADVFQETYGGIPTPDDEVRRITVEKTIDGKKVKWLYGRGKDREVKQAAIDSLKKQGLSVADALETYNEATGYTTA
jgi:hypothetical protein